MTTASLGLLSHESRRKPDSRLCRVFVLVHIQYARFVLPNGIIAYAEISCKIRKNKKSARRDSNPRPRPWQGRAPPTEPLAQITCPIIYISTGQIIEYYTYQLLSTLKFIFYSVFLSLNFLFQSVCIFHTVNSSQRFIDPFFRNCTVFHCCQKPFISCLKIFRHKNHIRSGLNRRYCRLIR